MKSIVTFASELIIATTNAMGASRKGPLARLRSSNWPMRSVACADLPGSWRDLVRNVELRTAN